MGTHTSPADEEINGNGHLLLREIATAREVIVTQGVHALNRVQDACINMINIEDIIAELRKEKNVLQAELNHIKQNHPDVRGTDCSDSQFNPDVALPGAPS